MDEQIQPDSRTVNSILIQDQFAALGTTPELLRMTELTAKTKNVLQQLDSNISKMRSEAAYLKEVSMQQESAMLNTGLGDSPHRVLDYRPSPRVFLSTGEIHNLRESISAAEMEKIEAEYQDQRVDPTTAREQYYEQFKKDILEKSLGASPQKPSDDETAGAEEAESSDLSDFPLPLWKAPKTKTPPAKSNVTIPQPFSFDVPSKKPKQPSIRETKLAQMLQEKLDAQEEEAKHEHFRAQPVPAEVTTPLYDSIVATNEQRRAQVKADSIAMTKAREAPFSFYERDKANYEAKRSADPPPVPETGHKFTANPIPMSTQEKVFERMCFENALIRKERISKAAQESLAKSHLPPRMEMHEQAKLSASLATTDASMSTAARSTKSRVRPVPNFDKLQHEFSQQLEACKQNWKPTAIKEFTFHENKRSVENREYMDPPDMKEKWQMKQKSFSGACLKKPVQAPPTTKKVRDWISLNQTRIEERVKAEMAKQQAEKERADKLESMRTRVHNCQVIKDTTAQRERERAHHVKTRRREVAKAEKEYRDTLTLIHESVRNRPLLVEEAAKQQHYFPHESESDLFIQEDMLDEDNLTT